MNFNLLSLLLMAVLFLITSCKHSPEINALTIEPQNGKDTVYVGHPVRYTVVANDAKSFIDYSFGWFYDKDNLNHPGNEAQVLEPNNSLIKTLNFEGSCLFNASLTSSKENDGNVDDFEIAFFVFDTIGSIIFYKDNSVSDKILITLNSEGKQLNKSTNTKPTCDSFNPTEVVEFDSLQWGNYDFTAVSESDSTKTWSGTISISERCFVQILN